MYTVFIKGIRLQKREGWLPSYALSSRGVRVSTLSGYPALLSRASIRHWFLLPSPMWLQAQVIQRALRLRARKLHQGPQHSGEGFVQDYNHWQFTTSLCLPGEALAFSSSFPVQVTGFVFPGLLLINMAKIHEIENKTFVFIHLSLNQGHFQYAFYLTGLKSACHSNYHSKWAAWRDAGLCDTPCISCVCGKTSPETISSSVTFIALSQIPLFVAWMTLCVIPHGAIEP